VTVSGDGIRELIIRNDEYDYHDLIIKNESELSLNLLGAKKVNLIIDAIIYLNVVSSEKLILDLSKDSNRMIIRNSSIENLDFHRCEFETVPSF
ncbi:hypothetical protein NAI34_09365, partial [Francisella tularensis subsp. holarctica]|nr:hypothetical protein [Francisella tularensis subsp. holarctica]